MTSRGHLFRGSRRVAIAAVGALAALALTPAAASHADSSSTVTVVGTSDVYDSDLIQKVIKPDFEKAFPQYTLNYVSLGTGAAIAYAEAGTASALLVHAASLENTFVTPPSGPTFSAEEAGRAIFYGDYVLLGPPADPAGVMTGNQPSHDMVGSFAKVLAAGQAGTANYVSRGGTPGTTTEEHAIWKLDSADAADFCQVTTANGGGDAPSTTDQGAQCPSSATPPSWYHITGLTQGPNVVNADTCNYTSTTAGNSCYVLTDRGTYLYLQSTGAIGNLQVVADDNAASAPGGQNLLINSFHAYAVNPQAFTSSPSVHINKAGALAFLGWLTSKPGQAAVSAYQQNANGGLSTFNGDAYPTLTAQRSATSVAAGRSERISGILSNTVPGTPPMAAVGVTLTARSAGRTTTTTTSTSSTGAYHFTFKPTSTATYTVAAGGSQQILQPEIASPVLTPPYSDLLQPTSKSAGSVAVVGAPAIKTLTAKKGVVTIKGTLSPAVSGSGAQLKIYANTSKHVAAGKALTLKATDALKAGATTFTKTVTLKRGETWKVEVRYVNAGLITTGTSATRSVHVS